MNICHIHDRDYTSWNYSTDEGTCQPTINPLEYKLFHGDVFRYHPNYIEMISSAVKETKNIPGILVLENNKTYGRTANKKRLLYKCKPNDPLLPHFLIPYDITIGFNKNFKNKFITFHFIDWEHKHPEGMINQNLGDVDNLNAFYEYQLYCKKLHNPITRSIQYCKDKLRNYSNSHFYDMIQNSPERFGKILPNSDSYIFTIDPEDCVDRDDALSIEKTENGHIVSVYISNVWVWLEALDIWDTIGKRISTIYLPDKKRSMLPLQIGEELCSLDEKKSCFAFCMRFSVVNGIVTVKELPFQCSITVSKSFSYESSKLLQNQKYQELFHVSQGLDSTIIDSHQVVSYWMTQMNAAVAKEMRCRKIGIFRCVASKKTSSSLDPFIRLWEQQMSGQYKVYESELNHETLQMSEYVHFTSPIRRMVDLLNQMIWVQVILSEKSNQFLESQLQQLDVLNLSMKNIRKVQTDCEILYQVSTYPEKWLEKDHDGTIISKEENFSKEDNLYWIYVKELKYFVRVKNEKDLHLYSDVKCKLFLIDKEDQVIKKVRIVLQET